MGPTDFTEDRGAAGNCAGSRYAARRANLLWGWVRSPEVLTRPQASAQGSQTFGFPPYAIVGRDDHFDWLSYKFAKASTHSCLSAFAGPAGSLCVGVSVTVAVAVASERKAALVDGSASEKEETTSKPRVPSRSKRR